MPITVKCCDCGKALKAPNALAGKKAKCPDCGAVVAVPNTAWEVGSKDRPPEAAAAEFEEDPWPDMTTRKPCPMCGEMIASSAAKCRFCGETLSSNLRERERQQTSINISNQLTGTDIALCVCFPLGCIVGIVTLITGQPARGLKMIGLAFVMPFLWGAIASIFK